MGSSIRLLCGVCDTNSPAILSNSIANPNSLQPPDRRSENYCIYENLKLTKKSSVLWLCELQSLISPTCQNSPPVRGLKQLPRWWRIVIPATTPLVISSNVSNFHIYSSSLCSCLPLPQPQHEGHSFAAGQGRNAELLDTSSSLCVPSPHLPSRGCRA